MAKNEESQCGTTESHSGQVTAEKYVIYNTNSNNKSPKNKGCSSKKELNNSGLKELSYGDVTKLSDKPKSPTVMSKTDDKPIVDNLYHDLEHESNTQGSFGLDVVLHTNARHELPDKSFKQSNMPTQLYSLNDFQQRSYPMQNYLDSTHQSWPSSNLQNANANGTLNEDSQTNPQPESIQNNSVGPVNVQNQDIGHNQQETELVDHHPSQVQRSCYSPDSSTQAANPRLDSKTGKSQFHLNNSNPMEGNASNDEAQLSLGDRAQEQYVRGKSMQCIEQSKLKQIDRQKKLLEYYLHQIFRTKHPRQWNATNPW